MEFKLRDAIRNRQSGIVAKATEFENKQIELENRECKSLLDPLSTERKIQVSLDSPFTGQKDEMNEINEQISKYDNQSEHIKRVDKDSVEEKAEITEEFEFKEASRLLGFGVLGFRGGRRTVRHSQRGKELAERR